MFLKLQTDYISWKAIVKSEGGIQKDDPNHIYLIDHAWTFRPEMARQQLQSHPGLLDRMASMFDLDPESTDPGDLQDQVMELKWKYAQTYSVGSAETIEDRMPVWYILDEFGSRIQHRDQDWSFRMVPFIYMPEGCAYSLLFPVQDLDHGEEVTRDYLEGPEAQDLDARKALTNIWSKVDMTKCGKSCNTKVLVNEGQCGIFTTWADFQFFND